MGKNCLEEASIILAHTCPKDYEVELVSTYDISFVVAGGIGSNVDMFCVKPGNSTKRWLCNLYVLRELSWVTWLNVQLIKILHDIVSFTFTMRSTILLVVDDFTKVATKSFASASTSQNLYFSQQPQTMSKEDQDELTHAKKTLEKLCYSSSYQALDTDKNTLCAYRRFCRHIHHACNLRCTWSRNSHDSECVSTNWTNVL